MANLAILGHASRGKEVIEIIEMLGGKNHDKHNGSLEWTYCIDMSRYACYYYIDGDGNIECSHNVGIPLPGIHFTLEEFIEKFPYKVGDSVSSKYLKNYKIEKAEWVSRGNRVIYKLQGVGWHSVEDLQPYKEENMEEKKYADLRLDADQDDKLATEATIDGDKITPPENYLIGKITKVDNGVLVEFVKKQPKYPKTYKECCDVLGISTMDNDAQGYKAYLIISFQELLIARDAYLKIAGEQMGLDKPWEPDWEDESENKYTIVLHGNKNCYANCKGACSFLTFPSVEMRDAFYENFKVLIEECKTFL